MSDEKIDVLRVLDQSETALITAGLKPESIFPQELREARAAVADLIEEHAAQRELLRIQDETMTAYRELVEHRNRQIYALGGEP